MMVISTLRLSSSLLLWAGYQALLLLSSTKYALAASNSITLDDRSKIALLQEPESESNPSSMDYYSWLYPPSSKTPVSQNSSKLKVSEPQLKLLLALVAVTALEGCEKQPDTLEKITELDLELKQKQYNTEHNVHENEFDMLDAHKKSQNYDAHKTDVDRTQTLDMRDKYHKRSSESNKRTNGQTVIKSSKAKEVDFVCKNISRVVDFLYNHVFGSSEKSKKGKVSPLEGNVFEDNQTGGKICENVTKDKYFRLNHDFIEAGQCNERYRRNSPLIPVYKDNTTDSNKDKVSKYYKNTRSLESLYSLVLYAFNQENDASFSFASIAENVEMNQTNSSKFEKNSSFRNNLQPSNIKENLINEKEYQRSSGWMRYIIIGASVVAVLILISLFVVYGTKLCKWQKNRKQQILKIVQPSSTI